MELKITKEKVLEAASKCSTAKATLETLFPECFIKTGFEGFDMKGLDKSIPYSFGEKPIRTENYIKVPLPNANNKWSIGAFEWAIKFTKQNEGTYISHSKDFDYNFIYIKIPSC